MARKTAPGQIVAAPRAPMPGPSSEPLLLLPFGGLEKAFPSVEGYWARSNKYSGQCDGAELSIKVGLECFREALQKATIRIWILDRFFFERDSKTPCAADTLLSARYLKRGVSIRILTSEKNNFGEGFVEAFLEQLTKLCENNVKLTASDILRIDLGKADRPQVHDRFAILDGELWHFGGSVGALNRGLTAASRGWCATASGAESFFEALWDGQEGGRRR